MLEPDFRDNADLFKVTLFRKKAYIKTILVRELQFTDNSSRVGHSAEEIQRKLIHQRSNINPKSNIKQTEVPSDICNFQGG